MFWLRNKKINFLVHTLNSRSAQIILVEISLDSNLDILTYYRFPDKTALSKSQFCYFSTKTYVVATQKNHDNEMVLLNTQNVCFY